ncbi:hypothetical protein chiPu_0009394 [Chiloscyllium punctatum]|uniref:Uncharacterized protein n=1 Tax=Chiloscyllium punctatum TaxID=137246 RepID=A0A401SKN1_CHIPU|nr:hypothetical protein [Chiloscyllium punctatum]
MDASSKKRLGQGHVMTFRQQMFSIVSVSTPLFGDSCNSYFTSNNEVPTHTAVEWLHGRELTVREKAQVLEVASFILMSMEEKTLQLIKYGG